MNISCRGRTSTIMAGVSASLVVDENGHSLAADRVDACVAEAEIMLVSAGHAGLARSAFRRHGRGRHAATLNRRDRVPYVLAQETASPLLFKGDEFIHTDIEPALKA